MKNLFDTSREVRGINCQAANDLSILARAFVETGNSKVAMTLTSICEDLVHAAEILQKAVDDNSREQLRDAERGMWNVFAASIAGLEAKER